MKKKLAGLAAVVLVVGMLGGCGNSNPAAALNSDLNQLDVSEYVTELCDYNNLSVEVAPTVVTTEEQEQLLLAVYQSNVTADNGAVTNRPVENGDTVIIDYEGKKDGVAFSGGTATGASLEIGSGQFIDGFEEGLIGVNPGETVDLNLTFPENYGNTDLAGQAVVFTVKVNYILPNLNELVDSVVTVMGLEGVSTVAELREYVNDYLQASADQTHIYNIQNAIMKNLMENSTMVDDLPETFINSYNHVFSDSLESMGAEYGIDGETYAYYFYGMEAADYIALYSEVQARQEMLLQAIANAENLQATDEELQELLDEMTANSGYSSQEEMLGAYTAEEYRNYLMAEKVMAFLVEKTKVTIVETESAE